MNMKRNPFYFFVIYYVFVCYNYWYTNIIIIYKMIEKSGGLISEQPPGTAPLGRNFASRNRIISGLCDILLVIEARLKSGTSITVGDALLQGRDIFAVPGRLTDGLSSGCNKLISEGAGMALSPDDILKALGLLCEEPAVKMSDGSRRRIRLNERQRVVYNALDLYPKTVDEIVRACHISISETFETLTSLCIKGAAKECGRGNYIKIE